MMVEELCSGYESHSTAAAANGACSPTLLVSPITIGSTTSTSPTAPAMIRRTQSLPTSTTMAETLLASTKSADRGEEHCVVVVSHAKSEEQYVDRYGFITEHQDGQQQHERGEGDNNNNNGSDKKNKLQKTMMTKSNPQKLAQQEANREARRVQKWTIMLDNWPTMSVHRRRLIRRRLRKGLPDAATRQRVWPILLRLPGSTDEPTTTRQQQQQQQHAVTKGHGHNNNHHDDDNHSHMSYGSLWRNNDNLQVQDIIERDIHRTFPKHTMFSNNSRNSCTDDADTQGHQQSAASLDDEHDGQASLRRVLRAYSAYDTEIGYCQGMNFIAAVRTRAMFVTLHRFESSITHFEAVACLFSHRCF
jgi:hypothetical protein